ncbi:N-lysine methyltransferase setd6-like isoform X1 [Ptychodera flava]|uniref:N-lysine methyltransferase setd6-like isoform X1 n=1 Tax=Ptychodera flava TaxID=63121 RepID=UPI00396A0D7D
MGGSNHLTKMDTVKLMKLLHGMDNPAKKLKVDDTDDQKLKKFVRWCEDNDFNLNKKVAIRKQGSCAEYGMVAIDDLQEGECLFEIKRSLLLHSETCQVAQVLRKGKEQLASASGWVPLLLALMYEYTNQKSLWRPYLDLCPDFAVLDQPMFWTREEVEKELGGTGIPDAVEEDLKNMKKEYTKIALPFMKKHPDFWNLDVHTFELYKKMVAFIMAYSFTESKAQQEGEGEEETKAASPVMVPVADILNHVSANNAHLNFGEKSLTMVSTRSIKKGEEIFNTYGHLSNGQLLHMYGFAEPYQQNLYGMVTINFNCLLESARILSNDDNNSLKLLEQKWNWMQEIDVVDEDDKMGIDKSGITGYQLSMILKVLSLDKKDFKKFKKSWQDDSDDDDEDEMTLLTQDDMTHMSPSSRKLLRTCLQQRLDTYTYSHAEDSQMLESDKLSLLSSRQKYALQVRHGQKQLLMTAKELCEDTSQR